MMKNDSRPSVAPRQTRRALLKAGAAVLTLGPAQLAWGAQIVAVRVWPAEDYTRVTLESDSALSVSHQVVMNPERLVVDIDGLELNPMLRELAAKVRADDPYIAGVRIGQNRPGVVRIVFDLKALVVPQVFALKPIAEYRHRLVFDLYPKSPPDPLQKLAMASEAKQRRLEQASAALGSARRGPAPAGAVGGADDPIAELARRNGGVETARGMSDSATAGAHKPAPVTGEGADTAERGIVRDAYAAPGAARHGTEIAAAVPRVRRLLTIALDPGHGGEDPGAIGARGSREKDVVLAIARRLQGKLEALPNMRVMLTRDDDYFVPLHVRVQKARRVQADLFVSIHADAFVSPEARGASVFALSERGASSTAARWLAQKENAADQIGGLNIKSGDRETLRVLLDLSTTAQIRDSLQVGHAVLSEIGGFAKLHKPRVEQAGFAVLKAPDIPSILIETAFISNPEEEARLNDSAYQDQIADAVVRGIRSYFTKNPPLAKGPSA